MTMITGRTIQPSESGAHRPIWPFRPTTSSVVREYPRRRARGKGSFAGEFHRRRAHAPVVASDPLHLRVLRARWANPIRHLTAAESAILYRARAIRMNV